MDGSKVYVSGTAASSPKVKAIVNFSDDSVVTLEKQLNIVESNDTKYFIAPVITGDTYSSNWGTAKSVNFALGRGDVKTATVSYPVYEVVDETAWEEISGDTSLTETVAKSAKGQAHLTQKLIEEGLAKNALAKASNVTYSGAAMPAGSEDKIKMTDNGDGSYTFEALKATGTLTFTAPSVYVNGILDPKMNAGTAEKDLSLTVTNTAVDVNVELMLYDSTVDGTNTVITEHTLNASYYTENGFTEKSDIVDEITTGSKTATTGKKVGEAIVNVSSGRRITLPTAAQFTSTPASGRVLAGWIQYSSRADALANTTPGVSYEPGDSVAITTASYFKALWADEYTINQLSNGNLPTKDAKGNTIYPTALSDISIGSSIPVVLKATKVTGVDSLRNLKGEKTYILNTDPNFTLTAIANDDCVTIENNIISGVRSSGSDKVRFTAKWKPADKEWTYTDPAAPGGGIQVGGQYTLGINAIADDTMEVGQTPKTVTLKVTKTNADSTTSTITDFDPGYTVTWTSDAPTVAKVDAIDDTADDKATVTALTSSATKVKITASVVDANGISDTRSFYITVNPADYNIMFVNAEGTEITSADALIRQTTGGDTILVKAVDKNGNVQSTGTWGTENAGSINAGVLKGDGTFVTAATSTIADNGTGDGLKKITVYTGGNVGKGKLTVSFKPSGKTTIYSKDIEVLTYAAVKLFPVEETANTQITYVTKSGTKVVDKDGKRDAEVIKLNINSPEATLDTTGKTVTKFTNIDLSAYSAEYVNTTASPVTKAFDSWVKNTGAAINNDHNGASIATNYANNKIKTLTVATDFVTVPGLYALKPSMVSDYSITGLPATLILDDSSENSSKVVTLEVSPVSSANTAILQLASDKLNIFAYTGARADGSTAVTGEVVGGTYSNDGVITTKGGTLAGNKETRTITISKITGASPRAGVANLDLKVKGQTRTISTMTVYINGLDTVDGVTRYYENGVAITSQKKAVKIGNTTTIYYFDEDGKQITNPGVYEIDGKKCLLISGGKLADKGVNTYDSQKYFVGDEGVVLTGWLDASGNASTAAAGVYYGDPETGVLATGLTKVGDKYYAFNTADSKVGRATNTDGDHELVNGFYVNAAGEVALATLIKVSGKQYLVDDTGAMVTYDMTKEGVITVGNIKYIIDKKTNEAKRDDVLYNPTVEWTVSFPNKYTKGTAAPELTYVVTAKSANTGDSIKADPVKVSATTTADVSASSTVTEATFEATASLAGYFTDAEGKTPATDVTKTITYRFADGGLVGISDIYYAPSVEWTTKWATKWSKTDAIPTMKYKVTYTSKESGKQVTTEELTASITPATVASDATEVTFVATADLSAYYTDETGATAVDPAKIANSTTSKTYKFKDGGESGSSGQDISAGGGITIEDLEEEYAYTGKQIKPAFKVVDDNRGETLALGTDYTVKYGKNITGTGTITVTGKGNYTGAAQQASFTIVDPKEGVTLSDLAGVVKKVDKPAAMVYTGEPLYPATITVTLADKSTVTLTGDDSGNYTSSGKDLIVVVSNNVNKGSGIVAVTGSDGVTKSATFKINPVDLSGALATGGDFDVTIGEEAEYRVKGTRPDIAISYNGIDLVEGQDFTVKSTGKSVSKAAKVTITGKGNFTKKFEKDFKVTTLSLSDCTFDAATVFEGTKVTGIKATILDPNGDALKVKNNYTLAAEVEEGGKDAKEKLVAGKTVTLTATAAGAEIEADSTASETFTVGSNLAKAKVKIVTKGWGKEYTGSPVELEDEDWKNISVTIKVGGATKTLVAGEDFKVGGYTNNVKKGTMKVTLVGTGTATENGTISGVKVIPVKILPKNMLKK